MRGTGKRDTGSQQEEIRDESSGNVRLLQFLVELQPGILGFHSLAEVFTGSLKGSLSPLCMASACFVPPAYQGKMYMYVSTQTLGY